MAELAQAPVAGEGTTAAAPEGTTQAAPAPTEGQATAAEGSSAQAGQAAPIAPAAQPFDEAFDPKSLPPELQGAYKNMHGAFTKRMQGISADRDLLDQAKQFLADPITGMQRMAQQYGYQLTRAEAAAAVAQQQGQQSWDPRSGEAPPDWNTVLDTAKQQILRELGPVIGNVQKLQAQNIESQLDGLDPQWRSYEDSMRDNLKAHPTLVNDVATLYRLSVPQDVIEARATQAAINRLNKTTHSARVSGTSSARSTTPAPREVKTFADAVEAAKEQLGKR
jgi:hypothetical protein